MRIIAACTLALIIVHLVAAPVQADQLKMECRVANGNENLGSFGFLFDTASGSLAVNTHSDKPPIPLFGFNVTKWRLLFAQGGHAVFYGIAADDIFGPVKIFSLNFENPNMFSYSMGGDQFGETAPQYKAKCRRLN